MIKRIRLEMIESSSKGIALPDCEDVGCSYVPESILRMIDILGSSVYIVYPDSRDSLLRIFPILTLRNKFDLFSSEIYYGEAYLNSITVIAGSFSAVAYARCRIATSP